MSITERDSILRRNPYRDRRSLVARAMGLSPIGDIASGGMSEDTGGAATVTWETSSDWDNAVSEEYITHASDVLNMAIGVDSFEDISTGSAPTAGYSTVNGSVTTTGPSDGSKSFNHSGDPLLVASNLGGLKPDHITFAYREGSSAGGISCQVLDTNGSEITEMGSANPQVLFDHGGGNTQITSSPSPNYDATRRFTCYFDWANETFRMVWEDLDGSTSTYDQSGFGFDSTGGGGIDQIDVGTAAFNGGGGGSPDGSVYVDQIYGVYYESSLTTATKSFASNATPDLQNLSYTLNGETIVLDVIGSPGTASEEVVSQTLDGASTYSLTWSNSHTDFRVKIQPSTTARDGASLPTFDRVELVS